MPKRRPSTLPQPVITDAQLIRIRAIAHQHLLAGGGLVPSDGDSADTNELIATVRDVWRPKAPTAFETVLERALPIGGDTYDAHEAVWSSAWALVAAEGEAGYLFGVAVGLEVAALTVRGELPRIASRRKGGVR